MGYERVVHANDALLRAASHRQPLTATFFARKTPTIIATNDTVLSAKTARATTNKTTTFK